ncbi:hypothetical protein X777_16418 [Ooceraea biroi]|uniref:Uncharacterized protein n=1 Tax=Ooceraea biroi TaxID=2015173 RepID=A0A026VUC5_OOCBI|nr:hypothetical protein X777_16418 [Ooceraea biroi]
MAKLAKDAVSRKTRLKIKCRRHGKGTRPHNFGSPKLKFANFSTKKNKHGNILKGSSY